MSMEPGSFGGQRPNSRVELTARTLDRHERRHDRQDRLDHGRKRRNRAGDRGRAREQGCPRRVHVARRNTRRRRARRDQATERERRRRRDDARSREPGVGPGVRGRLPRPLRPPRRVDRQRRARADVAQRHGGRLRDDLPGEPPRALPAHRAAARPPRRERAGAHRGRRVGRAQDRPRMGSTSTISRASASTARSVCTGRRSSPTSSSPASSPGGSRARASR